MTGKAIEFKYESIYTIEEIKKQIQHIKGIPSDYQWLLLEGKKLEDNKTITYFNIQKYRIYF